MKPSCERKPTASTRRKERAAHAVSLRTKRPVDVCTICLTAVIGPALRMAERRLGRYTPCGCERGGLRGGLKKGRPKGGPKGRSKGRPKGGLRGLRGLRGLEA